MSGLKSIILTLLLIPTFAATAQVESDVRIPVDDGPDTTSQYARTIFIDRDENRPGEGIDRFVIGTDVLKVLALQMINVTFHTELTEGLALGGYLQTKLTPSEQEVYGAQLEIIFPFKNEPFDGWYFAAAVSYHYADYKPGNWLFYEPDDKSRRIERPIGLSAIFGVDVEVPEIPLALNRYAFGVTFHPNPSSSPIAGTLSWLPISPHFSYRIGFRF